MDKLKLIKIQGQRDLDRIDAIIANIKQNMEQPGSTPLTSQEMRLRADRKRTMATQMKLSGVKVKEEYL